MTSDADYIDSYICKASKEKNYIPVVFDNLSIGKHHAVKYGPFHCGDLLNIQDLSNVFQQFSIKAVIHFARSSEVADSVRDPLKYHNNNIVSATNLLCIIKEYGIQYLLFSSTAAVYGNPTARPITESYPFNPINSYGKQNYMLRK